MNDLIGLAVMLTACIAMYMAIPRMASAFLGPDAGHFASRFLRQLVRVWPGTFIIGIGLLIRWVGQLIRGH